MASPPRLPPLSLPEVLSPQNDPSAPGSAQSTPSSQENYASSAYLNQVLNSPEGINCFGNERLMLQEQASFCNNEKLSDITLVVGGRKFYAHKIILVRASDVFERMLTGDWTETDKKVKIFTVIVFLHKYIRRCFFLQFLCY